MGEPNQVERYLIDVGDGALEVHEAKGPPGAVTVCCCHPVDDFGEGTARFLRNLSGARVVCINPRGIGGSFPGDVTSLESMAEDIERVRIALGIGRWSYWGISGGGWLGQLYARRFSGALNRLVLESVCACFRERVGDPDCVMCPGNDLWSARLSTLERLTGEPGKGPVEWRTCDEVGEVLVDGDAALLVIPAGLPATERMKAAQVTFLRFDSRDWLHEIPTPTLTLGSAEDPVVPVSHLRMLHQGLAHSELVVVPGAAHNPAVQGLTVARRALAEFLAG